MGQYTYHKLGDAVVRVCGRAVKFRKTAKPHNRITVTKFRSKAQLFTSDVMVAAGLILLMVSLVFVYWNLSTSDINSRQSLREMQRSALDTSSYLMRIYLVNATNTFDNSKLVQLSSCNYTTYKDEIGLSGYEYSINLSYINSTQVIVNGTSANCGQSFANSSNLVYLRRIGTYNNNEVILNLYVWK